MPFNFSPIKHIPKLSDIYSCIDVNGHEPEILARLVRDNTEIQGKLFTSLKEIEETGFVNISNLVEKYNNLLYYKHIEECKLVIENGHIFINGYLKDTRNIISKLQELASSNDMMDIDALIEGFVYGKKTTPLIKVMPDYVSFAEKWLSGTESDVDCEEKREIIKHLFEKSRVAILYGAAGTGKTTLVKHISELYADKTQLFLAYTNPAIDSLKRKISPDRGEFSTIASYLSLSNPKTNFDLVVIDECSTVSNKDMAMLLFRLAPKQLLLVGDTYQISSIRFGNWFSIARNFIPKTSVYELEKPYRSNDEGLLTFWSRVREMNLKQDAEDNAVLEADVRQKYSVAPDTSIFERKLEDEIILCLNYDGFYGINNINCFLQESNPNTPIYWGIHAYKGNRQPH